MVCPGEPGFSETHVSDSELDVDSPTSEEELERKEKKKKKKKKKKQMKKKKKKKKKKTKKKKKKNSIWKVRSRLFLRVGYSLFYIVGFHFDQELVSSNFTGDAKTSQGISGYEGVSIGAETDGQLKACHIVLNGSLLQLVGRPHQDFADDVHSQIRSWKSWEQAFDDGCLCGQMKNLLVLFFIGSMFCITFLLFRLIRH